MLRSPARPSTRPQRAAGRPPTRLWPTRPRRRNSCSPSREPLTVQLGSAFRSALDEPHDGSADVDCVVVRLQPEQVGEGAGLGVRLVGAQLQLGDLMVVLILEQLV